MYYRSILFYLLTRIILKYFVSCNVMQESNTIFDFTKNNDLSEWSEESDTVRSVGMSKATFVPFKNSNSQRAIFFTLLNPQPNGAGFAGVRIRTNLNLSEYSALRLKVRGQGQNYGYKVVLRHRDENQEPYPTYEQFFQVTKDFSHVFLPFDNFKPYYQGKLVNDTVPLDKSKITSLGLQIYGGVYMEKKQFGASSLEIDEISAVTQ